MTFNAQSTSVFNLLFAMLICVFFIFLSFNAVLSHTAHTSDHHQPDQLQFIHPRAYIEPGQCNNTQNATLVSLVNLIVALSNRAIYVTRPGAENRPEHARLIRSAFGPFDNEARRNIHGHWSVISKEVRLPTRSELGQEPVPIPTGTIRLFCDNSNTICSERGNDYSFVSQRTNRVFMVCNLNLLSFTTLLLKKMGSQMSPNV